MDNPTAPMQCFGDLPELDHVIDQLEELAEVAAYSGIEQIVQNSPLPVLRSRIDKQWKQQRDANEKRWPGAFDRSYLAREYERAWSLVDDLCRCIEDLPLRLDRLVLSLHRVMIVGNLTEDELRKTLEGLEAATIEAAELRPMAETGKKFVAGRKLNTGGPVRKAIARLLKKNGAMKNRDLWDAIKKSPPRGWTVMENAQGKYMEGKNANDHMGYSRFSEVAKEERDKLNKS